MPAGAAVRNQSVQLNSTWATFSTSPTASRLNEAPVKNRELVTHVVAMPTHIRYEPTRRAEGSFGLDPKSGGNSLMMGKMIPPLRAVGEGMNGARIRSANVTP